MSLALRFGRTLDELGSTMSSAEFSLWLQFYEENPWDGEWLRTGMVCSTIANYAGKQRIETADADSPFNYMPPWKKDETTVEAGTTSDKGEVDPVLFFRTQAAIMEAQYAASIH